MNVLSKPLAGSSSSSSSNQVYVHLVFLSFRGEETRNNITDHLYNTLLNAGIRTFLDEEIDIGKPLKSELESAIRSSRASIVVISEKFAESGWCLDELVLILDQKRNFSQVVIPIFYHVEPTDLRNKKSTFRENMAKHTKKMEEETDENKRKEWALKIKQWENALIEVSEIKGLDAKKKKETKLIQEVIDILHSSGVCSSKTLPFVIGRDGDIEDFGSWLNDGSDHRGDFRTIVGIGGTGKTSLAWYVFMKHSENFPERSFIRGIHEKCNDPRTNGLLDLQKTLYGDISKVYPSRDYEGPWYTHQIENVLANKKVFIVLDDIGDFRQLDALLGNKALHSGTKILITTKDASLTERCEIFALQVQPKHKKVLLKSLSKNESLELLCYHAFKSHKPTKGYEEVSEDLLKYCAGYPFALEELGKRLHKLNVAYCKDYIEGLKKEPYLKINRKLKLSLDSLQSTNDEFLFKLIACYFVGADKDETETILNACDIQTTSGIKNLTDRCLLSIELNNKLEMHPLIQEMGRDLARKEYCNNPYVPRLLCCHEESLNALERKNGKENIVGLALDMNIHNKKESIVLQTKSLRKMCNLKLLQLNNIQLSGSYEKFPKELIWLCMHGFPLNSIPSDLQMKNLVVLNLSYSSIISFGSRHSNPQPCAKKQKLGGSCSKDKQLLGSLKILDLSYCIRLQSLGGYFELPALEKLSVRNCISLVKVCELVKQCVKLVHIDLSYCDKFKRIPISIEKLKVETLLLDGCNFSESQIELRE